MLHITFVKKEPSIHGICYEQSLDVKSNENVLCTTSLLKDENLLRHESQNGRAEDGSFMWFFNRLVEAKLKEEAGEGEWAIFLMDGENTLSQSALDNPDDPKSREILLQIEKLIQQNGLEVLCGF